MDRPDALPEVPAASYCTSFSQIHCHFITMSLFAFPRFSLDFLTFETCTCRSRIGHGPCPCERSFNVRSILNLGGSEGWVTRGEWGGHEDLKKSEKSEKVRKSEN